MTTAYPTATRALLLNSVFGRGSLAFLLFFFASFDAQASNPRPTDIRCDVEAPMRSSEIGNGILVDDDCGMSVPTHTPKSDGSTHVSLVIDQVPFLLSYELFVVSDKIELATGQEMVIFEMTREAMFALQPVVQVRLKGEGISRAVDLVVLSDDHQHELRDIPVTASGAHITVELVRSRAEEDRNARVRLLVDGVQRAQTPPLLMWGNLPTALRYGFVGSESKNAFASSEVEGVLYFQLTEERERLLSFQE